MIVPTCRCAFFAAVMLLGVFMSDIAPAKKKITGQCRCSCLGGCFMGTLSQVRNMVC